MEDHETGGQQINNDAVAKSKTETRIRDGMSLADAFTKTFKEANHASIIMVLSD